jgi:hypothetical protein
MRFCLALLSASFVLAQSLTLTGPAKVRVGQQVVLSLNYTAGATPIAAIQWESPAQPWATNIPGKSITCNPANGRCVLAGLNVDALPAGVIATSSWTVPPSGIPAAITISAVIAADPLANLVAVAPVVPLPVSLYGDVTGDREVNVADINAAVAQLNGLVPCASADQNGDSVCNVVDVVLVVIEVLAAQTAFRFGLPPGIVLDADGTLRGRPEESGTWLFRARVRDTSGATDERTYSLTVLPGGN